MEIPPRLILNKSETLTVPKNVSHYNTTNTIFSLKLGIFCLVSALFAFLFSWYLEVAVNSRDLTAFVYSAVFAVLFLVLYLLESLFIEDETEVGLINFAQALAMTAPLFVGNFYWPAAAFIFIVFFVLVYGNRSGAKWISNSLRINFNQISRLVLPKGILAVSLVIAAAVPLSYRQKNSDFFIPQIFFESAFSSASGIIGQWVPDFNSSVTLEEWARHSAENTINSQANSKALPPAVKESLIKESSKELYKKISDLVGAPVNPKLTLPSFIYEAAKGKFFGLSQPVKDIIYAVFGAIIFLSIESMAFILRGVIAFLAFIVYQILLMSNFSHIQIVDRPKEKVIV